MSKSPLLNALSAAVYITIVATIMQNGSKLFGEQDSFLTPIAIISLFTLSAAVMGYLFLFQPLQLYLDGQRKEGAGLFAKTILAFAGITILIFLSLVIKNLF